MNATEDTVSGMDLSHSASEVVEMVYQMVFFIFGTPLNTFALLRTLRMFHRSHESVGRLIKLSQQLLIAHLLVLCIYCVWRTYWFMNVVWTQGDLMCKIYSVASALPFHLWSNMVAAIAVDMLCVITSPLNSYRNSTARANWMIIIAWTLAILCSLPMAIFRGSVKIPNTEYEQCYPVIDRYSQEVLFAFNFFHVITTFYMPLGVVIVSYALIGTSLRRQMAQRRSLRDGKRRKMPGTRFLRASIAIIATFLLTWMPYQVLALLRVLCAHGSTCEETVSKMNWLQAIIIASTCINPFLYKFDTWTSHGQLKNRSRKGKRGNSSTCMRIDNGSTYVPLITM